MRETTRKAAEAHAAQEYPREACGLIISVKGKERYYPCRNVAESAMEHFTIAPEDYAAAEDIGDIVAVVHSHPNANPAPSEADKVACEASGVPWHIVGYPVVRWAELKPTGYRAPLIGRQFVFGVLDCYSLARDFYREEMRIELPDFPRTDGFWKRGENLYVDNFSKMGFQITDQLEYGCGVLMKIQSDITNHAAVYVGNDVILHHLYGRLSCRETYGNGYYRKHTTHILKYVGT
jgi:proteasome lid subunit RPN8/RPN11